MLSVRPGFFKKSWIMPIRNISVTDGRKSERERPVEILKSQNPIVKARRINLIDNSKEVNSVMSCPKWIQIKN